MTQAFFFRQLWKPVLVISMAGIATAVWLEDVMIYIEEILALLFLFIMAGVIYLFNIYVFNSRTISCEDEKNIKRLGGKK